MHLLFTPPPAPLQKEPLLPTTGHRAAVDLLLYERDHPKLHEKFIGHFDVALQKAYKFESVEFNYFVSRCPNEDFTSVIW